MLAPPLAQHFAVALSYLDGHVVEGDGSTLRPPSEAITMQDSDERPRKRTRDPPHPGKEEGRVRREERGTMREEG